jgi:hypothetical protein|tara:strand:- start:3985 stop:4731 length:747 start_codon:yes stop_codon:yes gene_type:complete
MGHYKKDGPHMESAKQERSNLLQDNPVAKHASWMSKHASNSRMSPMNMGHSDSPAEKYSDTPMEKYSDTPMEKELVGNQKNLPEHLRNAIEAAPEMRSPLNDNGDQIKVYEDRTNPKGESQVDIMNRRAADADAKIKAYNEGSGSRNEADEAVNRFNFSKDSIMNVNKRIDRVLKGEKFEFTSPNNFKGSADVKPNTPHSKYGESHGFIKAYKNKDGKYVAVDKSVHDTYLEERQASGEALRNVGKKK